MKSWTVEHAQQALAWMGWSALGLGLALMAPRVLAESSISSGQAVQATVRFAITVRHAVSMRVGPEGVLVSSNSGGLRVGSQVLPQPSAVGAGPNPAPALDAVSEWSGTPNWRSTAARTRRQIEMVNFEPGSLEGMVTMVSP